jgi:hypothetical protein
LRNASRRGNESLRPWPCYRKRGFESRVSNLDSFVVRALLDQRGQLWAKEDAGCGIKLSPFSDLGREQIRRERRPDKKENPGHTRGQWPGSSSRLGAEGGKSSREQPLKGYPGRPAFTQPQRACLPCGKRRARGWRGSQKEKGRGQRSPCPSHASRPFTGLAFVPSPPQPAEVADVAGRQGW